MLIAKGENCFAENLSGINMVIKTDEAWNALLDTLSLVTDSFIETEIDFTHYMALAVIEEVKGNGGWSIDITGVTEHANKIVVAYTNLETGDATEVISQPYHIVKIPKSGKGVLFERTESEDANPLTGNWWDPSYGAANATFVTFSNNDTIYMEFYIDNIIRDKWKWTYRFIAEDSIQIERLTVPETDSDYRKTNCKIMFYSSDSLLIETFYPSDAFVSPPEFNDIKLLKMR